jgi:antitoxin SocA-like protein
MDKKLNFQQLILSILKISEQFQNGIGITRLIKLAYLVELFYYRKNKDRLTDIQWIYYKYGPYVMDIDSYIDTTDIISETIKDNNFTKYSLKFNVKIEDIPESIEILIKSTLKKYVGLDLDELLDYVYNETEPMMNVDERGDLLNFNTVNSENYYKVKELKLTDDILNEIKDKNKKKFANVKHF